VRHIVLTHLDFDHAGGLDDFPQATVHMMSRERDDALLRRTWLDRQRFRPQQWGSTVPNWRPYRASRGERWFGFECVQRAGGPAARHPAGAAARAHAGPRRRGGAAGRRPLAAAGRRRLLLPPRDGPRAALVHAGAALYQAMMEKDRGARLANQERLRALRRDHGAEVTICCGHDPIEFERLAGHSLNQPVLDLRQPQWAPAAA
jgi:hypothetical protein